MITGSSVDLPAVEPFKTGNIKRALTNKVKDLSSHCTKKLVIDSILF